MKMAGFGFAETNTQFAYCASLHSPHFPPEAAGGFSILFCILSFTEGKQYGVLLRGEMMADWTFKAKLELRYFHVRLPSETEWDPCSHWFWGRESHSLTSFWDKQNFIAVLDISWPHILWGHSFLWALQIPHSVPLCFLDRHLNLLWR